MLEQQLYPRYALRIDSADFCTVAHCFALDATYEVGGICSVQGQAVMVKRIRSRERRGHTRLTCNTLFDQERDDVIRGRMTFAVLDDHTVLTGRGGSSGQTHWRSHRR